MQESNPDFQENKQHYTYALRCWQESNSGWRFTLEAVDGRVIPRRGFASRSELLMFLASILPAPADS